MLQEKEFVTKWLETNGAEFYRISDELWKFPELGCEEYHSSQMLVELLRKTGFQVETGVAGMPTAFVARWGSGKPAVAFNCEYDALPGLSQKLISERQPLIEGAPGHGCGHNLLGVGCIMAAAAVKEWLLNSRQEATLVVFGTPAEELCIGKPYMARAGLFNGMDCILDWHPATRNVILYDTCNAYFSVQYHFKGLLAHGNSPWLGRSALDSASLMGHAIEILREHIPPGNPGAANTINYTYSETGPSFPNVVPDRSSVWVVGRATTSAEMKKIMERVDKCAEGAALAAGCTCHRQFISASHEKIPNRTISSVVHRNLLDTGSPKFNQQENEFARLLQRELGIPEVGMSEEIEDFGGGYTGVSDNSEFSWFAPFAMLRTACAPAGIGGHTWPFTAAVGTSIGLKGMLAAAKILAATTIELVCDPAIVEKAKIEWDNFVKGRDFTNLIPESAVPPVSINADAMSKYRGLMETKLKGQGT